MDLPAQLNPYSARFARLLFAAHPEWQALAAADPWPNATPGCFAVRVPSPADPGVVLSVATDGGEVTVGLGPHGWHDHHGDWTGVDEATAFRQALEQVAGIIGGALEVVVCVSGGRPVADTLVPRGAAPDLGRCDEVLRLAWGHPAVSAGAG